MNTKKTEEKPSPEAASGRVLRVVRSAANWFISLVCIAGFVAAVIHAIQLATPDELEYGVGVIIGCTLLGAFLAAK